MSDKDKNRNQKYLKIFNFKRPKTNIYSHDILPEEFHSILFIVSGVLNISMINKTHSFITHDLILIPNSIKFEIEQTDSDLKIYILCFSPLLLIDTHMDYRLKYLFLSNPNFMLISIGNNDILFIKKIFKLIYIAYKENKESLQKDLLTVGFNFLIKRKMNTQSTFANTQKQKQKIILNFFSILQQNFRREHQVKFYGDYLCITTGYLNKITKELTNKTVKNLIEEAVLSESKILLNNNDRSITEIADILNFNSVATFSNFFKKHTSLSPSQYRLKTLN